VNSVLADQSTETYTSNGLALSVKQLPQIIVPPVSLTVGGSVTTASFAVVVRSASAVNYKWTRNGAVVGEDAPYLKLTELSAVGSSVIKVEVRNDEGLVSATAKLTVGNTLPERKDAGSSAASQLYSYASWWVFWADALDSTKSGYWLIERVSSGTADARVVTPGRSLWVWGDSKNPNESAVSETWEPSLQSVVDALDSESAEFSVLAQGLASNYVLSGRVEPSGEAALYGAPAAMEGAYENASFGRLDLNLVWDGEQVLYFDGNSNIDEVKTQLKTVLAAELVKIANPKGD
jgi:hypothetical protein